MIPRPDHAQEVAVIQSAFPDWHARPAGYEGVTQPWEDSLYDDDLDMAGQLLRCRPDFFVTTDPSHPHFFAEVKAGTGDHQNIAVEALSFFLLRRQMMTCRCPIALIYAPTQGSVRGCWISNVLDPQLVVVPEDRWPAERLPALRDRLCDLGLSKTAHLRPKPTSGSGDPFVLVFQREWKTWPCLPSDIPAFMQSLRQTDTPAGRSSEPTPIPLTLTDRIAATLADGINNPNP